jgi:hypothetical protein
LSSFSIIMEDMSSIISDGLVLVSSCRSMASSRMVAGVTLSPFVIASDRQGFWGVAKRTSSKLL